MCTLLLVIGGRLVQLQGVDGSKYAGAAAAQRTDEVVVHAMRGAILDRDGVALAYTSTAQDITADPKQITAAAATAAEGQPEPRSPPTRRRWRRWSASRSTRSRKLHQRHEQYARARHRDLAGGRAADHRPQPDRHLHPADDQRASTRAAPPRRTSSAPCTPTAPARPASRREFNNVLAGKDGSLTYSVDNAGNINPSSRRCPMPARNGGTMQLTIDQSLQFTAQQYLDTAVQRIGRAQRRDGRARRAHRAGARDGVVGHLRREQPEHDQQQPCR